MSMCQFAVPLILPAVDSNSHTFLLFGLRDIVKRWIPNNQRQQKEYAEESIVQHSIPVISFVRLGEYSLSKSKILNQVLSPEEQAHDFFVHHDINGGDVNRKIADGLVEVAWYLPAGMESDLFHDPITITNLRGDLQNNKKPFCFLSKISQTVFIFIEDNKALESHHFTDINVSCKNYFFIINLQSSKIIDGKLKTFLTNLSCVESRKYLFMIHKDNKDTARKNIEYLTKIFPDLKQNIIVLNPRISQERQISIKLQVLMKELTSKKENTNALQDMAQVAYDVRIDVDENCKECKDTRTLALEITKSIGDVAVYKKETMKLQGDAWIELAKLEKELCQMKNQGNLSGQAYKSQLIKRIEDLRRQQSQQRLPEDMKKFLDALIRMSKEVLPFFLKWLKFYLDAISRDSILQVQQTEEKGLGKNISDRNLGMEHFLRELGQFYEAECFMKESGEIQDRQRKFHHLPEIGARLLLDGFPLELIDGDASNIPL
ncbi:up-regulator of cell proliferation-like [Lithobates pipiens]